jgi:recombination protein RecA
MAKKKTTKKSASKKVSALDAIVAKYGAGSARKLGAADEHEYETVSTGSIGLDRAIGIGGLPRGRIVEVYGPESSGKTTLTLHAIASAQEQGLTAAFIDAEHALDPSYAAAIGVDTEELVFSQPDYGEQALGMVDAVVRSGDCGVVVVDSVAALTPKAELDGEIEDHHVGVQARMIGKAMRRLASAAAKNNTLVIFIKSASGSGALKQRPGATRSSSTPRYGSTFVASPR